MSLGVVIPVAIQIASDADNRVVAGALATFTAAGTAELLTMYADADLTVPLSNPVEASAAGRFPQIFAAPGIGYDLNVTTPGGVSLPGYPAVDLLATPMTGFTSYDAAWLGSSSNPVLANGTQSTTTLQNGKLIFGKVYVLMGSGTTYGTGTWTFSLPIEAGGVGVFCTGTATLFDASAGKYYHGMVKLQTATTITVVFDNSASLLSPTMPFAWTVGDVLELSYWYEAA